MSSPSPTLSTEILAHATGDQPEDARYRVLMIAPTSFFADYGCHVRILEEARTLQALGHHVTIATYRNGQAVPGLDVVRTLPIPWRRDYEVGSSRHKLAFDVLLGMRLLPLMLTRLLRGQGFDILHAHLHEGALLGKVLGALFRVPLVFDFQGSLTEEMIDHGFLRRESWLFRPLRRLESWLDCSAPAVLTSSHNARTLLIEQFGCEPSRVHTLPDCVNAQSFRPASEQSSAERAQTAALRAEFGLPDEAEVVAYVGLLTEYQGVGLLLDAMVQVLRERPNAYLLLMGFPGVHLYERQAEALGIRARVIFTGRVSYHQLPSYLAVGDVAAAPKLSLSEGCGKLLNYMALALPTVAFDTPVAREYLGTDGLLAERGSVGDLARQLVQALDVAAGRAEPEALGTGNRLRQRAVRLFEWRAAGQQIVRIYRDVLGEPARAQRA